MLIVNYGGGTNSTALLVGAVERGIRPDLVVFADTGSEMPHTYRYLEEVSGWLSRVGLPSLTVARWTRSRPGPHGERPGDFVPLHVAARRASELPSKAYGYSGCTTKWKQQPIDREVAANPLVKSAWGRGETVERWIGYDADEPHRAERMFAKNPQPSVGGRVTWRAPLVEWGWGRDECVEAIARAGLSQPGKSSCFMCPAMRKAEIDQLGLEHPDLLRIALEIEDAARPGLATVKGLGRNFSWRDYIEKQQIAVAAQEIVEPECGCYDGNAGS